MEGKTGIFFMVPVFEGGDYLGMIYTIRIKEWLSSNAERVGLIFTINSFFKEETKLFVKNGLLCFILTVWIPPG